MRFTIDGAPLRFYRMSTLLLPWLWSTAALTAAAGLAVGLLHAPSDAQQGDAYRIVFIHVPAAWMSVVAYLAMAGWAAVGWIGRVRLASMLARAVAPTGLVCGALALVTGAFWGQPTWGAWWVWDARLTSELILLLLYAGYIALVEAIDDPRRADRASALIAAIGAINLPLIYFSVNWWNMLHQGASITLAGAPSMADGTLLAMGLMTLALWAWAFAIVFVRARAILLERDSEIKWFRALEDPSSSGTGVDGGLRRATA